MLSHDDNLYSIVRATKLGEKKLPPVLEELQEWFSRKYQAKVASIIYDDIDIGPAKGTPRLTFYLEQDTNRVSHFVNGVDAELQKYELA